MDNAGERIILADVLGDTLISFRYNDKAPWPEAADGTGYSLIFKDPDGRTDFDNATAWQASGKIHGSPGEKGTTVDEKVVTNPAHFSLFTNYPNPFNPTTTIRYSLERTGRVEVKVYDILGQQVAILIDEEKSAGTHRVTFDAHDFSSGVYLCILKTAEHVLSNKMILLK